MQKVGRALLELKKNLNGIILFAKLKGVSGIEF